MSDLNKLDNISNMSDEELDAFIKSELNSSLMEDIMVDEELINKTMNAVEKAEAGKGLELENEVVVLNNNRSVSKIRRYIPILSMAACTCIIVMAGSLIYSQFGKNKSENASMSKENMSVQENESLEDESISKNEIEGIYDGMSGIQNDVESDKDSSMLGDSFEEDVCPEYNEAPDSDSDGKEDPGERPLDENTDENVGHLKEISKALMNIWRILLKNIIN